MKRKYGTIAGGTTNDLAIMPAKAADTASCQNVSPHQPSILKDWKRPLGLNLMSVSLFSEFVDHK